MCNQRKSSLIQSPPPLPCDSRYNCDPDDNAVFPSNKVGHAANNPSFKKKALGVDVMEKDAD